jgi:nucleotide-binding universal stress UspA family protein
MNTNRQTVLACIDGSTFSRGVVDYGAWVSRVVGAPLKLLHNIEHREHSPIQDLSGNIGLGAREELLEELTRMEERRSKILLEQGKEMLHNASQRARAAGVAEPIMLQRHGGLAETLIDMEDEIRVLVLGVRGEDREQQEHRIGNHLESVIRALHRPVLVVNRPFDSPPGRCMLAYDGSEAAGKALAMAASSPLFKQLECHLVHVARKQESPVLDAAARVLQDAGLQVHTASLHGDVEQQLLSYQQQQGIELMVMGAFGHSRIRELLLGSVTHHMLTKSRVPLLMLR